MTAKKKKTSNATKVKNTVEEMMAVGKPPKDVTPKSCEKKCEKSVGLAKLMSKREDLVSVHNKLDAVAADLRANYEQSVAQLGTYKAQIAVLDEVIAYI